MKIKCRVRNFSAFGNEWSDIPLTTPGLTLIRGVNKSSKSKTSNGAGKSQILKAILFGIFGVIPDRLHKADLVNTVSKKNCCVRVEIELDGKTALIERYIADTKHKDNLYFSIDGQDCRGATNDSTQAKIEAFIGLDYVSFITAVLFTMDEDSSFAGKTPSNQDKVFTNLLKLDYLTQAREYVVKELKGIEAELGQLALAKAGQEIQITQFRQTLEEARGAKARWEREKQSRLTNLELQIEEFEHKRDAITLPDSQVKTLERDQVIEALALIDSLALQQQEAELVAILQEQERSLGGLRKERQTEQAVLAEVEELHGLARCPTCLEPLDQTKTVARVTETTNNISKINKKISTTENKIQKTKDKITAIKAEFLKASRLTQLLNRLERELAEVQQTTITKNAERAQYVKQIEFLVEQKAAVNAEQFIGVDVFVRELELDEMVRDLEDTTIKQADREYHKALYTFWEEGFSASGIRNLLIENIIPQLNQLATKYSNILTAGELAIQFSAQKELVSGEKRNKLEVRITDMFGSDSYHSSSGGEQRRIDLCVNLALHMLVASAQGVPFVFMDEVFVKMDARGIEATLTLLRELLKDIPSIFVITNQDQIASEEFNQIWTVVRNGRCSQLVLEEV